MCFDGMTIRDKKLLQFREQMVKRRKQLNLRSTNLSSAVQIQKSTGERQSAEVMDSLMWSEDIMNQSRGSVEGNNQMSKVPTMKSLGNVKPANPLHMT